MTEKLSVKDVEDLREWLYLADTPTLTVQKGTDGYIRVVFLDAGLNTDETLYWSFKDE